MFNKDQIKHKLILFDAKSRQRKGKEKSCADTCELGSCIWTQNY